MFPEAKLKVIEALKENGDIIGSTLLFIASFIYVPFVRDLFRLKYIILVNDSPLPISIHCKYFMDRCLEIIKTHPDFILFYIIPVFSRFYPVNLHIAYTVF